MSTRMDKAIIALCFLLGVAAIFLGGFARVYSLEEEVVSRCFFIDVVRRGPYCFAQYPFMAATIVWTARVLGVLLIILGYLLSRRILRERITQLGPPPDEGK